jgi:hypothetical protein
MAPWTLSLHQRFVIYDQHVLWKAGEQLSMVLHSIHPQNAIHSAPNANNQEKSVVMELGNGNLDTFSALKFVIYDQHVLWKAGEQL